MSGLREKKKKEVRENILQAAKEIFFTNGYENSTIEQIAEKAGIGVGTVYNYFITKADILISVVEGEVDIDGFDCRLDGTELEKEIVDIVLDFTWRVMGKMRFLSKKIWKELLCAFFSSIKSDNKLVKGLSSIDFSYIVKLKTLLNDLKAKKLLPDSFNTDAAAMVIYGVFMTQTMLYIVSDEMTFEMLKREIRDQIEFVFEGKNNWKDGTH